MIYVTKISRRILEIRYAAGEIRDLCPVCEVGLDIAACATVTRDLCPVCEMGLNIAARATEHFEIRLHSKYRTLERNIYIKYICLSSIYWFLSMLIRLSKKEVITLRNVSYAGPSGRAV